MATLTSDLVTADVMPDGNVPLGVVLSAIATYTVPASGGPATGDVLQMVPVPDGAKILEVVVHATGGTSSLTLDVGDGGDADRYLDGLDGSAAIIASVSSDGDAATALLGHEYSADDTIDITFLGAGATAAVVYTMVVNYIMA